MGGNASEQQVVEAFKILTADANVKALLAGLTLVHFSTQPEPSLSLDSLDCLTYHISSAHVKPKCRRG
jgi:hypothetical protein